VTKVEPFQCCFVMKLNAPPPNITFLWQIKSTF
jgi:hypothetical protein